MRKIIVPIISLLAGMFIVSLFDGRINIYFGNRTNSVIDKQPLVYEDSVITNIVQKTLPSVVTIGVNETVNSDGISPDNPLAPYIPFANPTNQGQVIKQNIGSGFILSANGLILTNKHVVSDISAAYRVITDNNKTYNVVNIYRDPLNDLAIVKINAANLQPLTLGNSSNLELGQMVIAIGTPLGELTNTVTHGIVSGLGRGITAGSPYEGSVERIDNVIQTDAPINPGNSGGPLLDTQGKVIGINTAIAEGSQDIGFAIPVDSVKILVTSFEKNGSSFSQPYLGVRYNLVNIQSQTGAYVIQVVKNSPADKAGIVSGDIITEFNGQKIQSGSLIQYVMKSKIGDKVNLTIIRSNKSLTKQITLAATP